MKLPAGSLEPVIGHGKWHEGIDAAGLKQLSGLAKDIDKTIDTTVKSVARAVTYSPAPPGADRILHQGAGKTFLR